MTTELEDVKTAYEIISATHNFGVVLPFGKTRGEEILEDFSTYLMTLREAESGAVFGSLLEYATHSISTEFKNYQEEYKGLFPGTTMPLDFCRYHSLAEQYRNSNNRELSFGEFIFLEIHRELAEFSSLFESKFNYLPSFAEYEEAALSFHHSNGKSIAAKETPKSRISLFTEYVDTLFAQKQQLKKPAQQQSALEENTTLDSASPAQNIELSGSPTEDLPPRFPTPPPSSPLSTRTSTPDLTTSGSSNSSSRSPSYAASVPDSGAIYDGAIIQRVGEEEAVLGSQEGRLESPDQLISSPTRDQFTQGKNSILGDDSLAEGAEVASTPTSIAPPHSPISSTSTRSSSPTQSDSDGGFPRFSSFMGSSRDSGTTSSDSGSNKQEKENSRPISPNQLISRRNSISLSTKSSVSSSHALRDEALRQTASLISDASSILGDQRVKPESVAFQDDRSIRSDQSEWTTIKSMPTGNVDELGKFGSSVKGEPITFDMRSEGGSQYSRSIGGRSATSTRSAASIATLSSNTDRITRLILARQGRLSPAFRAGMSDLRDEQSSIHTRDDASSYGANSTRNFYVGASLSNDSDLSISSWSSERTDGIPDERAIAENQDIATPNIGGVQEPEEKQPLAISASDDTDSEELIKGPTVYRFRRPPVIYPINGLSFRQTIEQRIEKEKRKAEREKLRRQEEAKLFSPNSKPAIIRAQQAPKQNFSVGEGFFERITKERADAQSAYDEICEREIGAKLRLGGARYAQLASDFATYWETPREAGTEPKFRTFSDFARDAIENEFTSFKVAYAAIYANEKPAPLDFAKYHTLAEVFHPIDEEDESLEEFIALSVELEIGEFSRLHSNKVGRLPTFEEYEEASRQVNNFNIQRKAAGKQERPRVPAFISYLNGTLSAIATDTIPPPVPTPPYAHSLYTTSPSYSASTGSLPSSGTAEPIPSVASESSLSAYSRTTQGRSVTTNQSTEALTALEPANITAAGLAEEYSLAEEKADPLLSYPVMSYIANCYSEDDLNQYSTALMVYETSVRKQQPANENEILVKIIQARNMVYLRDKEIKSLWRDERTQHEQQATLEYSAWKIRPQEKKVPKGIFGLSGAIPFIKTKASDKIRRGSIDGKSLDSIIQKSRELYLGSLDLHGSVDNFFAPPQPELLPPVAGVNNLPTVSEAYAQLVEGFKRNPTADDLARQIARKYESPALLSPSTLRYVADTASLQELNKYEDALDMYRSSIKEFQKTTVEWSLKKDFLISNGERADHPDFTRVEQMLRKRLPETDISLDKLDAAQEIVIFRRQELELNPTQKVKENKASAPKFSFMTRKKSASVIKDESSNGEPAISGKLFKAIVKEGEEGKKSTEELEALMRAALGRVRGKDKFEQVLSQEPYRSIARGSATVNQSQRQVNEHRSFATESLLRQAVKAATSTIKSLFNRDGDFKVVTAASYNKKEISGTPLFLGENGVGPSGEFYLMVEGHQRKPTLVLFTAAQVGNKTIPFNQMSKITFDGTRVQSIHPRKQDRSKREIAQLVGSLSQMPVEDLQKKCNSVTATAGTAIQGHIVHISNGDQEHILPGTLHILTNKMPEDATGVKYCKNAKGNFLISVGPELVPSDVATNAKVGAPITFRTLGKSKVQDDKKDYESLYPPVADKVTIKRK